MDIETHPPELKKEILSKWVVDFTKKIKRTTTRTAKDRLILAVERRHFESDAMARWNKVIFDKDKAKIVVDKNNHEEFEISRFERKLLDSNKDLYKTPIMRSELRQETGQWWIAVDNSITIKSGGEALIFEENIKGLKVAVRIQCFDSFVFAENHDEYSYEWFLSKGKLIKKGLFRKKSIFRLQKGAEYEKRRK